MSSTIERTHSQYTRFVFHDDASKSRQCNNASGIIYNAQSVIGCTEDVRGNKEMEKRGYHQGQVKKAGNSRSKHLHVDLLLILLVFLILLWL